MRYIKTLATIALLALASPASADWALYTNTDNKTWFLAGSHVAQADCERTAKKLVAEKKALGAGCSEWSPNAVLQQAKQQEAARVRAWKNASGRSDESQKRGDAYLRAVAPGLDHLCESFGDGRRLVDAGMENGKQMVACR